jgi:hypothetical protein
MADGVTFTGFFNDPTGMAVYAALVAAGLDFAFGVFAAAKDGTFALDSLAAWVRKHLLGRVFPVSLLAATAYVTGNPVMAGAAALSLTTYAAETLASIYGSIKPPAEGESPKAVASAEAKGNPIPTD